LNYSIYWGCGDTQRNLRTQNKRIFAPQVLPENEKQGQIISMPSKLLKENSK
jgi:hypothetical protein